MLTPPLPLCRYASFVWKFSRTSKVGQRIVGVEMAGALLRRAAAADEGRPSSIAADGVPQTLWRLLVARAADKAPNVRAKALSCLATTLDALHSQPGRALLKNVQEPLPISSPQPAEGHTGATPAALGSSPMPPPPSLGAAPGSGASAASAPGARVSIGASPASGIGSDDPRRRSVGSISTPSDSLIESATTMEASLPALGGMLKDRCADEKATVRRSALSALESWARASGLLMNAAQLKVIQQRCASRDSNSERAATRLPTPPHSPRRSSHATTGASTRRRRSESRRAARSARSSR